MDTIKVTIVGLIVMFAMIVIAGSVDKELAELLIVAFIGPITIIIVALGLILVNFIIFVFQKIFKANNSKRG